MGSSDLRYAEDFDGPIVCSGCLAKLLRTDLNYRHHKPSSIGDWRSVLRWRCDDGGLRSSYCLLSALRDR